MVTTALLTIGSSDTLTSDLLPGLLLPVGDVFEGTLRHV